LSKPPAYRGIKKLFQHAGLKDSEDEIYSPHSMRTFADSLMSKFGLDRKYIELIIGHETRLGASASYKDWDAIGQKWFEACGRVRLGTELVEVIIEDKKAQEEIETLKKQIKERDEKFEERLNRALQFELYILDPTGKELPEELRLKGKKALPKPEFGDNSKSGVDA
jgi:hypothetical protein